MKRWIFAAFFVIPSVIFGCSEKKHRDTEKDSALYDKGNKSLANDKPIEKVKNNIHAEENQVGEVLNTSEQLTRNIKGLKDSEQIHINHKTISNDSSISVLGIIAAKSGIPMGTSAINIRNNELITDSNTFGPPIGEATANEGSVMLIFEVKVNAESDDEWVKIVRSIKLIDKNKEKHLLDRWHYNNAYRPTLFLDYADGLRFIEETKLLFAAKDSLVSGMKLQIDDKDLVIIE